MINHEKQLETLLRLGKAIQMESDLDGLLLSISSLAREMLEADRCSIFLHDVRSNELWTKVAHGVDTEIRIPADKGVAGMAFLSSEMQIVVDAYNDFRFNPSVDVETGYQTKTILAMPLLDRQGEVLGVFQALNKQNGIFSTYDGELLLLVSHYISSALENAILIRSLQESRKRLIYKLSSAAEFKDEDTSKHTQRVGHYSALIAERFGLPSGLVEMIRTTAPMHDAGKIGIPDSILKKPGKLTDEEFEEMKGHPMIGYELLKDDDPLLTMAAEISRDHHEKYDGTGYPQGLAGDAIPIHARITAIADVFDALTSKRPYKLPWSFEKATRFVEENRGKHFDPELVDVFLSAIDEVHVIYERLKD